MQTENYAQGQVWNYKTRPGEETSRIWISKIEDHEKLGAIYHIAIDGLQIRMSATPGHFQSVLHHSPVSRQTLDASVTELLGNAGDKTPDVSEGYNEWKAANGGVFTIPVAEIVQFIESAILGRS